MIRRRVLTPEDHLDTIYEKQTNQKVSYFFTFASAYGIIAFTILSLMYYFGSFETILGYATWLFIVSIIIYRYFFDYKKFQIEKVKLMQLFYRLKAYCA